MAAVEGILRVFVLHDVAEAIQLEKLAHAGRGGSGRREPPFRQPAPDYVRFEVPPHVEKLAPVQVAGETFTTRVRYFPYGVISVELEQRFAMDWPELVTYSARWTSANETEQVALAITKSCAAQIARALDKPYSKWLSEDYCILQITRATGPDGEELSADAMLSARGSDLARMVRGEIEPLSAAEQAEALQNCLSCYGKDLLVAGWGAAVVYDTPEAAEPVLQLLEHANTQLLEFRHYDELLTTVLGTVYKMTEGRSGFFARWQMASRARRLNGIRLEITELTERSDNAIHFLSDMFYARVWRLASARVGVGDYRAVVERKLRIAGDLYDFMVNEFHQARSFVLEAMVVAILVIELVHLFLPK